MNLNYLKELSPVLYGSGVVKILPLSRIKSNTLCFSPHWHERMEILRVISGTLFAEIGQEKVEVKKNQVAIIPPCRVHSGKSGESGVVYETIMFDIAPICNSTPTSKQLLEPIIRLETDFSRVTANPQIFDCAEKISEYKKEQDSVSALLVTAEIYRLLALLYRYCAAKHPIAPIKDERLRNVLDYINQNFLEDISSASLSKKFGYSPSYFSRRFKQITGISPAAYIRILRLEEAKKRLTYSKESIGNIAADCGFEDLCYFSLCFKKNYGITPTEYINSERKN